ncbi:MAG: alanyl-tRNA editing protein [Bacillati bacterium ANGP1]|uniref:Alanyl-tRNA editing protein n=1 Tax=Candidatus Segetimicrobium genomatis TaxID=2569760 RepID=A0A537J8J0_9BACT|nr:MAG: alanyl-tRNA editing protein [Terrabacteria group bacterium ANGP1]
MTERLYYTDAYRRVFDARVTSVRPSGEWGALPGVVLDRTAFYPTSGGQPHDTGTLAGLPVRNVIDGGEEVIHVVEAPAADPRIAPASEVQGVVDWERRFDHMQQHTAQHVLSAAFAHLLEAETVSVHLGGSSTLDLAVQALTPDDGRRVEERANQIAFDNRPVTIRLVSDEEAASLGLRRPPRRAGTIRVVEVEGWDRSACGGTHVNRTGEIGPVLLRRWERTKGQIRVEFLSGWRAIADYRWKHALVSEWSARLTVGDRELGAALERVVREARERERALAEARGRLIASEAAERLAAAPAGAGPKVLRLQVSRRDPDEVRSLLRELTSRETCVVLAGDEETGRLYFARSPGAGPAMAALIDQASRSVGGRGGGTAEFAQGSVPPGDTVSRALAHAEEAVRGA